MRNDIAYFTERPLDEQWGDDWNDAPYEYNAGEPYGETTRLYFIAPLKTPDAGYLNSPFSVKEINKGAIPWLQGTTNKGSAEIYAGTPIEKFKSEIERIGGTTFPPTEEPQAPNSFLNAAWSEAERRADKSFVYGESFRTYTERVRKEFIALWTGETPHEET